METKSCDTLPRIELMTLARVTDHHLRGSGFGSFRHPDLRGRCAFHARAETSCLFMPLEKFIHDYHLLSLRKGMEGHIIYNG